MKKLIKNQFLKPNHLMVFELLYKGKQPNSHTWQTGTFCLIHALSISMTAFRCSLLVIEMHIHVHNDIFCSECKFGSFHCETKQCPAVCTAWGSVHMSTFNGRQYSYMPPDDEICSYTLVEVSIVSRGWTSEKTGLRGFRPGST